MMKYSYIFSSMFIQLLGSLSSFLIIFMIAHYQGADKQGQFIFIKGYFDTMVSIGLFGLPQSIIYFINAKKIPRKTFFQFSFKYVTIFYIVSLIVSYMILYLGFWKLSLPINIFNILLMAASGYILYGIWRSIYITYNDKILYAVLTALPNIVLFVITLIFIFFQKSNYENIYLIASVAVVAITFWMIKNSLDNIVDSNKISVKALFGNGIYVFIHTMMFALQLLLSYQFILWIGGDKAEIGYFGTGYYVIQIPLLILATIMPLLFNYLSSQKQINRNVIFKISIVLFFISLIFVFLSFVFADKFVLYFFGEDYSSSVDIIKVLSISVPFIVIQRVMIIYFDSIGKPKMNAWLSILRFMLVFALALIYVKYGYVHIISISYGMLMAEFIIMIIYIIVFNRDRIAFI